MRSTKVKWAVGLVVAAVLAVTVGTWIYINLIREDAEDRLTLTEVDSTTTTAGETGTTEAGATTAPTTAADASIDGTWNVGAGSEAGYRATEVLFGQDATATGRTDQITGSIEIDGTTVTTGSFTVDMASVESPESRRDEQYRTRIMEVGEFPTSTFELTEPIELESDPAEASPFQVSATGDLTIHGVTKNVTIELDAQRLGDTIEIVGSTPVKWSDYEIPDPSGGPATVTDNGEMEFKVVLSR